LARQLDFVSWAEEADIDLPFEDFSEKSIGLFFDLLHGYDRDELWNHKESFEWVNRRLRLRNWNRAISPTFIGIEDHDAIVECLCAFVFGEMIISGFLPKNEETISPSAELTMIDATKVAISELEWSSSDWVKPSAQNHIDFIDLVSNLKPGDIRMEFKPSLNSQRFHNRISFWYLFELIQFRVKAKPANNLVAKLPAVSENRPMFKMKWGFSAGETAFLNIVSRIWDASVMGYTPPRSRHLCIVIDEPTTHFHPEWQRNFIKYMNDLLPKIFPERRVQLIFTTHSPLTIADLPKEHVLYIRRDDENGRTVIEPETEHNTFASDIFYLYRKTFKTQDAFFSGLGREKLNEYFKPVNENEPYDAEAEEKMLKFANMVGDQVIREHLFKVIREWKEDRQ
jgi:hypothetical protein